MTTNYLWFFKVMVHCLIKYVILFQDKIAVLNSCLTKLIHKFTSLYSE